MTWTSTSATSTCGPPAARPTRSGAPSARRRTAPRPKTWTPPAARPRRRARGTRRGGPGRRRGPRPRRARGTTAGRRERGAGRVLGAPGEQVPRPGGQHLLAPAGRRLHHHLGARPGRVQPHPRPARAARRARRLPRRRPHDAARLGRGPGAARPRRTASRRQQHPRGTRACARQRPPVPRRAVLRLMAVPERLPRPARQQEPQADGHVPDARAGQGPARAGQRPCAVPAPQRRGLVSVRRHRRAADR